MCQVNLLKNLPWKKWSRTTKHSWIRCIETTLFWMEAYEYIIENQIMPTLKWQKPLVEISDFISFGNSLPNSIHGVTRIYRLSILLVHIGTWLHLCFGAMGPGYYLLWLHFWLAHHWRHHSRKIPLIMSIMLFHSLGFGISFNLINYMVLSWLWSESHSLRG